jgi:hypothetical protein
MSEPNAAVVPRAIEEGLRLAVRDYAATGQQFRMRHHVDSWHIANVAEIEADPKMRPTFPSRLLNLGVVEKGILV